VGSNSKGQPVVKTAVLTEALSVFADEILSDVYVGWAQGYLDEERAAFVVWAKDQPKVKISHPREAYQALIKDLAQNPSWLA
jgi:CRISPR-associated protein Cst2